MNRSIRPDAVLIQAVIAGALSFAHLHDLAAAAGQSGWKAWAYPVSVDLLLVAAWRRLRAGRDRSAWTWFAIALAASLGANVATAGLLDLNDVPAWLRILVAGWPALAFLGGTLLVHAPANQWRKAYFDPAVSAAGLTDVTPHDLRTSHGTWVADRYGVMTAAHRLGHSNASVTTRHYARPVAGRDDQVAEAADVWLGGEDGIGSPEAHMER
ncbi:DUF2637 domain-containing protein [Streptomyces nigra]|uniref:DUF2637 domain-containing protein n=1 Tax=Streptomyces nigra TaxID=1827580 RepID=UPI00367C7BDF